MFINELKLLNKYLIEEYVGFNDKKDIIASLDFSNIHDFFPDVTEQLNKLHDPHLRIIDKLNTKKVSILCKNHNNQLFVVKSIDPEIAIGSEIIKIGKYSIQEIINIETDLLFDPNPERYEWHNVLRNHKTVTFKNGEVKNIFIESNNELYDEEYRIEKRDDYIFIRLPDFKNVNALYELIKQNSNLLKHSKKFIIDVRDNRGGSDFAYVPLFEYIFPPGYIFNIDYGLTFNYSKKYCDYMISKVDKDLMKMDEGDTKEAFKEYRKRMSENYGKGMTKFSDDIEPIELDGIAQDIKVIVIANERCGSSGDNFVETVKHSEFVTVIGRATKGMNDYANCGYLYLNDQFDLLCPYSRYNGLDYGVSMALKGIQPDIELPWTKEELQRDLLLEKAVALLKD